MSALFVTGTGTDIGKTFVAGALLRRLRGRGVMASALKPAASGFDPANPGASDAGALLEAMGLPASDDNIATIAPYRFAAALAPNMAARAEGKILRLEDLVAVCQARVLAARAPLLVEGVGGVMSPVAEDGTCLDLARALGLPCLLVAGSHLGAISHALTAARAIVGEGLTLSCLVVNETPGGAVGLADTAREIARFFRGAPVLALARGANGDAMAAIARACGLEG